MPLYTLYLDPAAYGVLSIVTAVNGFLGIVFTLGLTSAMTRYYFEYENDHKTLSEFWGTILTLILIASTILGSILLLVGDRLLRPLIGAVPFWPYVALGVLSTFFQPFFNTHLAVLQMRNQASQYALMSIASFVLTVGLTIFLIIYKGCGVQGPLIATLIVSIAFFALSLWMMRNDLKFGLNLRHLRTALRYSLPLIPHSVAGQTSAVTDRLVINSQLGAAATGLYSVGSMVAMVVEVIAQSINRAYVPLSMAALKRGSKDDFHQIRAIGTLCVAAFCLLGACVGTVGNELLWLMANKNFSGGGIIIPFLVFAGVANGIYLLFVNVLFYEQSTVKLVPLGTLTGAVCSVSLSLLLIPHFGLLGAATATLLAQIFATILIAKLGLSVDPVKWSYARFSLAFMSSLAFTFVLSQVMTSNFILTVSIKLLGLTLLVGIIGGILWGRPLILFNASLKMLQRKPEGVAVLLTAPGSIR